MFKFFDLFRKSKIGDHISPDKSIFKRKYECFKRLLISNDRALKIITDLEHVFYRDKPFTLAYVLIQSEILIGEVYSIVEDLNEISGGEYPQLFDVAEKIGTTILKDLEQKKKIDKTNLILPLEMLSRDNMAEVGGKAANLGEVYNRAHLPVPQGFAVTAYACQYFFQFHCQNTRSTKCKLLLTCREGCQNFGLTVGCKSIITLKKFLHIPVYLAVIRQYHVQKADRSEQPAYHIQFFLDKSPVILF